MFCPKGETLELAETGQGGQEMVFKGYLGGKTDLARDCKKKGKDSCLRELAKSQKPFKECNVPQKVNGGALPRAGNVRKGIMASVGM